MRHSFTQDDVIREETERQIRAVRELEGAWRSAVSRDDRFESGLALYRYLKQKALLREYEEFANNRGVKVDYV